SPPRRAAGGERVRGPGSSSRRLLSDGAVEVRARRPERGESLDVLLLGVREIRLCAQQLVGADDLVPIALPPDPKPPAPRLPLPRGGVERARRLLDLAVLVADVQERRALRSRRREARLLELGRLLGDVVTPASSVQDLPLEEGADREDVSRQKIHG